jgi:hypothetical protein
VRAVDTEKGVRPQAMLDVGAILLVLSALVAWMRRAEFRRPGRA